MSEVISTTNLTKIYGETRAVDKVNLSVKQGEIFGFLGLNGAGKTTTIRMLLGMIAPTSGQCYIQGQKVSAGHPPILLKVEKEDLEMFFLRSIKEIGGGLQ